MSVVGPRPVVEEEIELFGNYKEKILSVSPGLTSKWIVSGHTNTTYEERVKIEASYVDEKSIILDLKIILETIKLIFFEKNIAKNKT